MTLVFKTYIYKNEREEIITLHGNNKKQTMSSKNIDVPNINTNNLDVPEYENYENDKILKNWEELLNTPELEVKEISEEWLKIKKYNKDGHKEVMIIWSKLLRQHGRKIDFGKEDKDGEFILNPMVKMHLSKILPKNIAKLILESPPKYPLKGDLVGKINGLEYQIDKEINSLYDLYIEIKKYK